MAKQKKETVASGEGNVLELRLRDEIFLLNTEIAKVKEKLASETELDKQNQQSLKHHSDETEKIRLLNTKLIGELEADIQIIGLVKNEVEELKADLEKIKQPDLTNFQKKAINKAISEYMSQVWSTRTGIVLVEAFKDMM